MERFFEIIANSLSEFFHTNYIAFFQLSPSQDELILKYASGFHPESLKNLRRLRVTIGVFQRLMSEVGSCGQEKNFQIENEIFKHEKELAFRVRMDGLESMISVPIFTKGNVWGILALFSQEKFNFKKQDGGILNLWRVHIEKLQDFFPSYLETRLEENLVQILGDIELLKSKLRDEEIIQTADMINALTHLGDAILKASRNLYHFYAEPAVEDESKEKPAEEILAEEVITIEGEKVSPLEKRTKTRIRRVLIVDDQPIITDLLVDVLKRMGFTFEVALGGKDGLKIFAKDGFDLVITDLSTPDISGWEVSKSVKRQNPSVPVVLITAWGVEPDPYKIKNSGVDFVINKPFQIDQLEKIITNLVDRRKVVG
jgi:CheY-like chemotaxis protein/putative methionine-R-sulfoxide reductase with GAF domain